MSLLNWTITIAVPILAILWWYLHVPWHIPRTLPRIPLYVSFLELWYNLGHSEVYDRWIREPMEKHGAVVIWISGQWHIVFGRPDFLIEVFKNYETYENAGNQVRMPKSAIGTFFGDNMVNSAAPNWKLYSSIMRAGIQKPFEPEFFQQKARQLARKLIEAQECAGLEDKNSGIFVMPFLQKFAVDGMAHAFFNLDLQSLERPDAFEQLLARLKPKVFQLLYRHFPFLDRFSCLIPARRQAFDMIEAYGEMVCSMARDSVQRSEKQPNVAAHMLQEAYETGQINRYQLCSNLKIVALAGHDTIQALVACAIWELGSNRAVQDQLRAEVLEASKSSIPVSEALTTLPYLLSTTHELLRLYPPLSTLPNRRNVHSVCIGDEIPLAANTWLGWNAYAVHTNTHIWGATAREFRPERWGTTVEEIQGTVRRQTVRGAYIPFISHARKCTAQGYALMQIKLALYELVAGIEWKVGPRYRLKMNGGNLTFPAGLRVVVQDLRSGTGQLEQ